MSGHINNYYYFIQPQAKAGKKIIARQFEFFGRTNKFLPHHMLPDVLVFNWKFKIIKIIVNNFLAIAEQATISTTDKKAQDPVCCQLF